MIVAHVALSETLEDPDAGNDDVRGAAIDMCEALNSYWSECPNGAVEIKHFIAAERGAWGRGETIADARRNAIDNMPGSYEGRVTVFGSDQPLEVETDLYLRVYAMEGAVLVKFEV